MKKVDRWQCEKCGALFDYIQEARNCEDSHRDVSIYQFIYEQGKAHPTKVKVNLRGAEREDLIYQLINPTDH